MTSKIVMACFGDQESAAAIEHWAQTGDVIAVAFDFGGVVSLNAMRDLAIAAGALRCHALDVREEFAREILLPAARSSLFTDAAAAIPGLAAPFVAGKLQEIALAEQAICVLPDHIHVVRRAAVRPAVHPRYVDIRFEAGVPVAINGVDMTLTELLESIETITGESALAVLQRVGSREDSTSPDSQRA